MWAFSRKSDGSLGLGILFLGGLLLASACPVSEPTLVEIPLEIKDGGGAKDGGTKDAGRSLEDAGVAQLCPPILEIPRLGMAHAEATEEMAQKWIDYQAARTKEGFSEAIDRAEIWQRYRIEQKDIERGCYSVEFLVDVGRNLFARDFSKEEGLGNDLAGKDESAGAKERPNLRRFQKGFFGGPDATSCLNCHWKRGFAGGGDRVDNSFLFGDGDDVTTHDGRNPPSLWGAGWSEIVAKELTRDLQAQKEMWLLEMESLGEGETARIALWTQDVYFGQLEASRQDGIIVVDSSGLEGVDADLSVKPFGWKGVFSDLRDFSLHALQVHLGMQAEEVIDLVEQGELQDLNLGNQGGTDPDGDGVERELTAGQMTALQLFLATQDVPVIDVPEPEDFALRWAEGSALFDSIGCAYCHRPFLEVRNANYEVQPYGTENAILVSLEQGARPFPPRQSDGVYRVPVFSDFKRHAMGDRLPAQYEERGVAADFFMTRRLMGVSQSGPWMHSGAAASFDEAIYLHGGEGSEAAPMSDAFFELSTVEKGALRIFLDSLRRAPSIRIR